MIGELKMAIELKDKALQEILLDLDENFLECLKRDYEKYKNRVYFGVRIQENNEFKRFCMYFSKDDLEFRPDFQEFGWNQFPDCQPPSMKRMFIVYEKDGKKSFRQAYFDEDWDKWFVAFVKDENGGLYDYPASGLSESEFTTLKFCRANVENLKMFLKEFEEYKQAGGSIDG